MCFMNEAQYMQQYAVCEDKLLSYNLQPNHDYRNKYVYSAFFFIEFCVINKNIVLAWYHVQKCGITIV